MASKEHMAVLKTVESPNLMCSCVTKVAVGNTFTLALLLSIVMCIENGLQLEKNLREARPKTQKSGTWWLGE